MNNRRIFWLGVISLILLFVANLLEIATKTPPDQSYWWAAATWVSFIKELGIAFFIALIISIAIERAARTEFDKTIKQRVTEIQENVFKSTFSRNIPKALIDEVENLVLRADFIRRDHRTTYRLSIRSARAINPAIVNDFNVVFIDKTTFYVVKNVSGVRKDFSVKVGIEKPPIEELKNYVSIDQVRIRDQELTPEMIRGGDMDLQDAFKNFEHTVRNIEPNQEVTVLTKCTVIKMLTDVEIWRSLLPSDGMHLTVQFPPGTGAFGASSLHRAEVSKLVSDDAAGYHEWKLDQAVLPHQGIVFWWKC